MTTDQPQQPARKPPPQHAPAAETLRPAAPATASPPPRSSTPSAAPTPGAWLGPSGSTPQVAPRPEAPGPAGSGPGSIETPKNPDPVPTDETATRPSAPDKTAAPGPSESEKVTGPATTDKSVAAKPGTKDTPASTQRRSADKPTSVASPAAGISAPPRPKAAGDVAGTPGETPAPASSSPPASASASAGASAPPAPTTEAARAARLAADPDPGAARAGTGSGWRRFLRASGRRRSATPARELAAVGAPIAGAAAPPPSDVSESSPGGAIAAEEPPAAIRIKEPLPTDRPANVPPDPWTAFATTPERRPGRIVRATRAFGRALIHEYAVVIYLALLLAVAITWPTLQYPLHTLPQDLGDPARQAWQIAWSGHILLTDPVRLWQSNAFFPEPNSFAYGDSLLGYAPAGMIGEGPLAAILRYNVLFVLAHALLLIGAYALVRQLGAGRTGSAVAAVAFAYAPWRLAQEGHLDIVSAGGIPLALAMIAHGHGWSMRRGFRRAKRNAGWAAAGWLIAAWQVSLGFSLGLPFLGVLGLILLVLLVRVPIRRWRRPAERPVLGWRLITTDVIGALIVAGVAALIAVPYFKGSGTATATAEIKFFSPPLRSLLIGPAESRIWGGPHQVPRSSLTWPAEMSLLPGFVLYALALAGLAFSIWTLWQRLLLLAGLAATIILALGTTFFDGRWTYLPLFGHLPASLGARIPGRLMLWATLLLAVLAAGAVAEFVRRAEHWAEQRIPPWPGPWLRLATLVPLALVLAEGWNSTAHPTVPDQPTAMRTVTGPMLVLPTAELTDQMTMLWSTSRFQQLANGSGGFAAEHQAEMRRNVATFPDAASIQYLRSQGITTVVLLRDHVAGTSWERSGDIPVDALGITREDLDDAVLFRLTPNAGTGTQPGTQPTPGLGGTTPPGLGTTDPAQPTLPTQPTQGVPTLQAGPPPNRTDTRPPPDRQS